MALAVVSAMTKAMLTLFISCLVSSTLGTKKHDKIVSDCLVSKGSVSDFKTRNLTGEEVNLKDYRGKIILAVNVATW